MILYQVCSNEGSRVYNGPSKGPGFQSDYLLAPKASENDMCQIFMKLSVISVLCLMMTKIIVFLQ